VPIWGSGGVVGGKPPFLWFLRVFDPPGGFLGNFFSENVKYGFHRKQNFIFYVFQDFSKFFVFWPKINPLKQPEIRHFETML